MIFRAFRVLWYILCPLMYNYVPQELKNFLDFFVYSIFFPSFFLYVYTSFCMIMWCFFLLDGRVFLVAIKEEQALRPVLLLLRLRLLFVL